MKEVYNQINEEKTNIKGSEEERLLRKISVLETVCSYRSIARKRLMSVLEIRCSYRSVVMKE